MRLIDAENIERTQLDLCDLGYDICFEVILLEDIESAPTIEAEPVRHRTWVIKTHDDGYGEFNVKHCPDCDAGLPPEFEANYCYWCGAKMDGGKNE